MSSIAASAPLPESVYAKSRDLPDGPLPDAVILAMKPQQLHDDGCAQYG